MAKGSATSQLILPRNAWTKTNPKLIRMTGYRICQISPIVAGAGVQLGFASELYHSIQGILIRFFLWAYSWYADYFMLRLQCLNYHIIPNRRVDSHPKRIPTMPVHDRTSFESLYFGQSPEGKFGNIRRQFNSPPHIACVFVHATLSLSVKVLGFESIGQRAVICIIVV